MPKLARAAAPGLMPQTKWEGQHRNLEKGPSFSKAHEWFLRFVQDPGGMAKVNTAGWPSPAAWSLTESSPN